MRILLDESLPRKFGLELPGHYTQTVQRRGWAGLGNGKLLREAASEFDGLLTGDQNLATLPIAVIVLVATDNRIGTLRPLIPQLLDALKTIRHGQLLLIGT